MKKTAITIFILSLLSQVSAIAEQSNQQMKITDATIQAPTIGSEETFTGIVSVINLYAANAPSRGAAASVSFKPGARSAWHTHPMGQNLIVTEGSGLIQQWGGKIQKIKTGDVIWTPPGVKHWHGASPTTGMTHIAIQEHLNGNVVNWIEKVSDKQYNAPVQ